MANFELTRDLWTDALFLAGELTDGTSPYGTPQYGGKALDYLTAVLRMLYVGGSLADVRIVAHDWLWARTAYPRPQIVLESAWNGGASTLTLTGGLATATLGVAPPAGVDLEGWRVFVQGASAAGNEEPWTATVTAHTTTSVTFHVNWPYPTGTATAAQFYFARIDYDLPIALLRFVGPLWLVSRPGSIPIISPERLEADFPLSAIQAGTPKAAAIVGFGDPRGTGFTTYVLRVSHYIQAMTGLADRRFVPAEYVYIPKPAALAGGASEEPPMPAAHRRLLSFGVAYYLARDKRHSAMGDLAREFAQSYLALVEEHERNVAVLTAEYGSVPPAGGRLTRDTGLYTASGLRLP